MTILAVTEPIQDRCISEDPQRRPHKSDVEYEIREAKTERGYDTYKIWCIKVNGAIFKARIEDLRVVAVVGAPHREPPCLTDEEICKICNEVGKVTEKGTGYLVEVNEKEDRIYLVNRKAGKVVDWTRKSEEKTPLEALRKRKNIPEDTPLGFLRQRNEERRK